MEELDLKELFNLFWSKIIQIILIVVILAGVGCVYTFYFTTPKYSSSTTLLLVGTEQSSSQETETTNSITTADITLNSELVETYSVLIKSDKVIREVISNLGINVDVDTIKDNLSVSAKDDTEVIEITVTNEDPVYAAKIANETATVFSEMITEIYNMSNIYIVDEAEVSTEPSNINHMKDIVIFIFIGLVIAVIYVLIANMLDTTIKTPEDIEKGFGMSVLASIPVIEKFEVIKEDEKDEKRNDNI